MPNKKEKWIQDKRETKSKNTPIEVFVPPEDTNTQPGYVEKLKHLTRIQNASKVHQKSCRISDKFPSNHKITLRYNTQK